MFIPLGDPAFQSIPSDALLEIAKCLSFNPTTTGAPPRFVRDLPHAEQLWWFDCHRREVEEEFCRVGSWTFGETRTYDKIVRELASKIGADYRSSAETEEIERAIVTKVWNDAVAKLTPEQVQQLRAKAEELSQSYGKSLGSEMAGVAVLSAAQLSGFGVYILGSTLLGAMNGALGLGLGFGAFTGLSSIISTVIGPIGWAALGLVAAFRLGAPNYKKILPAVIIIAINRPQDEVASGRRISPKFVIAAFFLLFFATVVYWFARFQHGF